MGNKPELSTDKSLANEEKRRIDLKFITVLKKIYSVLADTSVDWVLTGSLSFALRGMETSVHDIDLQTDTPGAYKIQEMFREYVITPVKFQESEKMRSHLGKLSIDGVEVEIMGDIEKCINDSWESPPKLSDHKEYVDCDGLSIPVLSLPYEYDAYLKIGRNEKAKQIAGLIKQL